jgi:hypothetical protein
MRKNFRFQSRPKTTPVEGQRGGIHLQESLDVPLVLQILNSSG